MNTVQPMVQALPKRAFGSAASFWACGEELVASLPCFISPASPAPALLGLDDTANLGP